MVRKIVISFILFVILIFGAYKVITNVNLNPKYRVGEVLDSLDGVSVHYNGGVNHVSERNLTKSGYNLGLKYQCVEFVKRYYYQHLKHEMPDSYGHAKDFFNTTLDSGVLNKKRNLIQYRNGAKAPPKKGDILVYKPTITNPYGHVAIVSNVSQTEIEIIQQNPGPFSEPRDVYLLNNSDNKWTIKNKRILGWLRKN